MENYFDNIVKIYYIKGDLELISSLILGSGETTNSDNDLIRDWEGEVFVPGTSIAGTIRSHLSNLLNNENPNEEADILKSLFGNHDMSQSLIKFYDAHLKKKSKISIRDGVAIDYLKKVAKENAKYDYEILEPGAVFNFNMKLIIRQKHQKESQKIKNLLYIILKSLKNGELSLGAKTSRGFGQNKLENIEILRINLKDEALNWLNFDWDTFKGNKSLDSFKKNNIYPDSIDLFTIIVNFTIPYSILIREYNPFPKQEDVRHLKSNNKNIISGTSWTGALRNSISNIELALRSEEIDSKKLHKAINKMRDELFGFVLETKNSKNQSAKRSRIHIKESEIINPKTFPYMRTKIDRFTGGVVHGALFSEAASYGGTVDLTIKIRNPREYEIGLIILAIKEIWKGLQPVGGTASIGRGILKGNSITLTEIFDEKTFEESKYIKEKIQKFAERLKDCLNNDLN